MKVRRILYLASAAFLLLCIFTLHVIGKNVELEATGIGLLTNLMVFAAFGLLYLSVVGAGFQRDQPAPKKLGALVIASVLTLLVSTLLSLSVEEGFETKNLALIPFDYGTIFVANFVAIVFGVFVVLLLATLRDLLLYKPRSGIRRNLFLHLAAVLAAGGSTLFLKPLESSILTSVLYVPAIGFAIVNSFRLPWIVYLSKREKLFTLAYSFLLFGLFLAINVILAQSSMINHSLLYYSYPLRTVAFLGCLFGNIYVGMAFVSTLFHLPTAEAFERKTSEVSSLHNLSRLITRVFDFNELVDTVTTLTLQVCEARSCWLEIIHTGEEEGRVFLQSEGTRGHGSAIGEYHVQIASMKNITRYEIEQLIGNGDLTLRESVLKARSPIVIDNVAKDPRFAHLKGRKAPATSLAVVPLVGHTGVIGILYTTKDTEYGFFKDDVAAISAFGDQATTAIENSRLIKKSIEKERLQRELMLAQEMQRRLLPQTVPSFASLEVSAASTPAFEVGGDYYDFLQIDAERLGIVVGDVSGKGLSAAFYMSEVKGIFQALCRLYPSPREFMIKANEALASSIDKHSFISLIYVVVDLKSGTLTLARAGHCPLLHVSGERAVYLRPGGMGLGLRQGALFANSIEEQSITLRDGDVCVLYTDGVTEARRGEDEFGYHRLLDIAVRERGRSAPQLKETILETVQAHTDHQINDDDLTIVVLKWKGANQRISPRVS